MLLFSPFKGHVNRIWVIRHNENHIGVLVIILCHNSPYYLSPIYLISDALENFSALILHKFLLTLSLRVDSTIVTVSCMVCPPIRYTNSNEYRIPQQDWFVILIGLITSPLRCINYIGYLLDTELTLKYYLSLIRQLMVSLLHIFLNSSNSRLHPDTIYTIINWTVAWETGNKNINHFGGDRSLQVAAPTLWNSLPAEIRNACSVATFKKMLNFSWRHFPPCCHN
jgi:hypothetical protein